jgi:hypothetical protein
MYVCMCINIGDGSWILPLLRLHMDPRFGAVVKAVGNRDKEVMPIPYRLIEAQYSLESFVDRADSALQSVGSIAPKNSGNNSNNKRTKQSSTTGSNSMKMTKKEKKDKKSKGKKFI